MMADMYEIRSGKSRQFTSFDTETASKTIHLKPGEKRRIIESDQSGIISRMWMTFSGWFWQHWNTKAEIDPSILKLLIIRIYWDGSDQPSVEAPVGDFFGIGHCEYRHFTSKYLGMSSGGFYSYFPMPYTKVRIELENLHQSMSTDVFFNANYEAVDELPETAGRFHCQFHTGRLDSRDPVKIMHTKGKGHFAGCCLSMQGKDMNYLSFLEAPEYFYIDSRSGEAPTMVGTGLEDYFNGGWYFRDGEFYSDLHGAPLKDTLRSMVSMYRFHEQDAIRFDESIRMCFENHLKSDMFKPFWYASTAYWYQSKAVALESELPSTDELMSLYRVRDVDHQSIP